MGEQHTDVDLGREVTRFIPVPKSISSEAQQFLAMGMAGRGDEHQPDLDDADAWRALADATNEMLVAVLEPTGRAAESKVETTTIDGVPVFIITPPGISDATDQPTYLDIHGGGFTVGSGDACRVMAMRSAEMANMRTWSIDYRMPPEHPYPAALDDCIAVYRNLLGVRPPEQIAVGGGSAGGNLAAALMLRARDEGLALPGALVLLTPEADLTESGDSFMTNLGLDVVLQASLAQSIALYARDHDLTHPYLSPLFGEFDAFPPTLLQTGTRDLFLSNTVRLHRKMRAAGVAAELHVFEAMPHGGFFGAPEDGDLAAEVGRFLATHVPQ